MKKFTWTVPRIVLTDAVTGKPVGIQTKEITSVRPSLTGSGSAVWVGPENAFSVSEETSDILACATMTDVEEESFLACPDCKGPRELTDLVESYDALTSVTAIRRDPGRRTASPADPPARWTGRRVDYVIVDELVDGDEGGAR